MLSSAVFFLLHSVGLAQDSGAVRLVPQVSLSPAVQGSDDWPYMSEVQDWWLAYGDELIEGEGGLRERAVALGLPRDTTFLVHAPTGQLLAPAPSSVREADPVQIVLLTPSWVASDFSMTPTSCAKPSRFDLGDAEDVAGAVVRDGGLATQDLGSKSSHAGINQYQANLVGQHLSCGAGTLSYSLKIAHPDGEGGVTSTTSDAEFGVRDRVHLAGIVAMGWDFGSRTEAWIDTSGATTDENGVTYQGTVDTDTAAALGPGVYAGGMWMIGGVDYADMRWYNYFANPFFAVGINGLVNGEGNSNTVRITSPSYLVGTAITPTGGISLAVGASVRPDLLLRGHAKGDLVQDGSLRYESTWSGVQPAFFLGLTVDSRIYKAISERVATVE